MTAMIPVLAAPALDPGCGRVAMSVPHGLTVAGIVDLALPGLAPSERARARVMLVTPDCAALVPPAIWHRVRPHPGVQVVIRVVPGKDALRSILSIVVSVAAFALGAGPLGLSVASALGVSAAVGSALVTLGVNLIGAALINALVPPVKPDRRRADTFVIAGWRNRMDPGGAVPVVLGSIRNAPPFAAGSYTEIVGDQQYVRAMLTFGEGRVAISGLRIGETAIEEFDEVDIEIREGQVGDDPCSLYPRQIVEESIGVELTRPLPRDDAGEIVSGASIETPVVRTTGADAVEASVILAWPGGLIEFDSKGRKRSRSVSIRIEQRLVTGSTWALVTTLNVSARKAEGFYRQHGWLLPTRGRWQVRLTMLTDETTEASVQQRTQWAALQTIRPEYPLAYPRPLALVALRIRATHQLSGQLDTISALVTRICPDWDAGTATWIARATSNPASLYRHVLQMPANPKAVADAGLDLAALQDWHAFCVTKALHYNRVLEAAGTTLREVLTEIAAAGRATPRHDGTRWGVVIDRPSALVVDHINPRNAWGFKLTRTYAEQPHALVVNFLDEENDFRPAQRIVVRPGYAGDITLTEELDVPGLTNPATVWREGLRRFHEAAFRPDVFEVTQESAVRVATRGDTLALSHDVLSRTQWAGRVRRVTGPLVEIDEVVTMVAGGTYGLRFRSGLTTGDTIGTSTVRTVETVPGDTTILSLAGTGLMPQPDDLIHFGPLATESHMVVITGIETTDDQCSILRAVAAAPEIDALTAAATPPAWSSRVGAELDDSTLAPAAPRFTAVTSGLAGTGTANLIVWMVAPGVGQIAPASYGLDHRLGTSGAWTSVTVPAANGGGELTIYNEGDTVQLRVRGISAAAVAGAWSPTVTIVVGSGDAAIPGALNSADISIATRLGGASITIITPADAALARLQIYRAATTTLDRATDAYGAPFAAEGARSYLLPVGDQTRVNAFGNGTFADGSAWTVPTDVTIAGGVATKVAGAAGRSMTQGPALTAGAVWRTGYRITARTAGGARIRCAGTPLADVLIQTAVGTYRGTITIPPSPGLIGVTFTLDAALSVDDAFLYLPTPACLPQGVQYLWIEPQNDDGTPGPVAGPFTITID